MDRHGDSRTRAIVTAIIMLLSIALPAASGEAQTPSQITLDGSMGGSPRVLLRDAGNRIDIPASVGRTRGSNLFHSFGQFNVLEGDRAVFTGPASINNVIGRITGGDVSLIHGTVASEIAGANLFLVNPHGFVFGPNARLDVSGSFHATTASYLRFADGARFFAQPIVGEVLSSAAPSAFGFLPSGGAPTPSITVRGDLQVDEGQTLSLVGGDVTIHGGSLAAPGGRVQITSVAAPSGPEGEVAVTGQIAPGAFAALGAITVSGGSLVGATGMILTPEGLALGAGGGRVLIRGGSLVVDRSRVIADTAGDVVGPRGIDVDIAGTVVLRNGASISTATVTADAGGDVQVTAGGVRLQDASFIETATYFGSGAAGDLTVTTPGVLDLRGGARIDSLSNFATGSGGTVSVSADIVDMRDSTRIGTSNFGDGGAGDLTVTGRTLTLTDGARIHSITDFGTGRGGHVTITATESFSAAGADLFGTQSGVLSETLLDARGGDVSILVPSGSVAVADGAIVWSTTFFGFGGAGDVLVRAGNLSVTGGGSIASQTAAPGPGGRVTVDVGGSALVSGPSSGIISASSGIGDIDGDGVPEGGAPGELTVAARNISVTDGALIGTNNILGPQSGPITVAATESLTISGGATITSQAFDQPAGQITLSAPTVSIQDATITTSTIGTQDAGDVVVNGGTVTIGSGAQIASRTFDASLGAGGDITIGAVRVDLNGGATITAQSTGTGNAGNITVRASDAFTMNGASITTRATVADGGNIVITAPNFVYLRNSQVTTSVESGIGNGGNITVDPQFLILSDSTVRADAFGGNGGNILMVADVFLNQGSVISASSALGVPGTIDIQATVSDVSGTVTALPEGTLQAATLLRAACAARLAGGKTSSLVLAGREGLAADPSGLLPTPVMVEGPAQTRVSWGAGEWLSEATSHGIRLASLAPTPGHPCR